MSTLGNSVGPKQWDTYDKAEVNDAIAAVDAKADGANTALTNVYTKTEVDTIVDNLDALPSQTGFAGKYLKTDGSAATWEDANNYVHPENHSPSIITQDTNNRFVTDTEKSTWNSKLSTTDTKDILTSTETTKPLSANQGRVLKELIDNTTTGIPSGGCRLVVFTNSGTYDKPNDVKYIKVTATGGGGGGCSSNNESANGGGAATVIATYPNAQLSSSITVTIGAGGGAGVAGGSTTFSAASPIIAVGGGSAGSTANKTAEGGQASACTAPANALKISGGSGIDGGIGGGSYWGGAKAIDALLSNTGAYGSGGGGPWEPGTSNVSRVGSAGIVVI